jgi:hypothetical protein
MGSTPDKTADLITPGAVVTSAAGALTTEERTMDLVVDILKNE